MISTGNDIVALKAVRPGRALQPEYYSKIISGGEENYFHTLTGIGISFETYVWLLWSIKESAYKYCRRFTEDLAFSPTSIIVNSLAGSNGEYAGSVTVRDYSLHFQSKLSSEWISSVVNSEDTFDEIFSDVRAIDGDGYAAQSEAVRRFALGKLAAFIDGPLSISKDPAGFPVIMRGGDRLPVPLSFSHHGKFVAYSFRFPSSTATVIK